MRPPRSGRPSGTGGHPPGGNRPHGDRDPPRGGRPHGEQRDPRRPERGGNPGGSPARQDRPGGQFSGPRGQHHGGYAKLRDQQGGSQSGSRHGSSGSRAGIETPKGAVWLYGQHAVAAALANRARRLRRLLLTEEAEAALAARLTKPWSVQAERVERGRLDGLLGRDTVHQGIGLLADPLATPTLAQALERPGPVVVLDQVTDPRNVGALLRSAAAFGAAALIVQDRNAPEETGALAKAASGALETVPLLRAVNIARTLIALKAASLWTVGLDASAAKALSGPALADRRVALVLGAEHEGLRRLTRETCDELGKLEMPGGMESLNVSAAATVALYEISRPA